MVAPHGVVGPRMFHYRVVEKLSCRHGSVYSGMGWPKC